MKKFYIGLLFSGFVFQQLKSVSWADLSLKKIFGTPEHIQEKPLSEKERLQYADDLVSAYEKRSLQEDARLQTERLAQQIKALDNEIEAQKAIELESLKNGVKIKDWAEQMISADTLQKQKARVETSDDQMKKRLQYGFDKYEQSNKPKSWFDWSGFSLKKLLNDYRLEKQMETKQKQFYEDRKAADSLLEKQIGKTLEAYVDQAVHKSVVAQMQKIKALKDRDKLVDFYTKKVARTVTERPWTSFMDGMSQLKELRDIVYGN